MCNQQSRSNAAPAAVMACAVLVFAFAPALGAAVVTVWRVLLVVGAVVLAVAALAGVARFVVVPVLQARHPHRPMAWPVTGRRRVDAHHLDGGHPALSPAADTTTPSAQAREGARRG